MQYTTKQLQEKYKSLPEDLKDAIWSTASAEIIQSIGKKYGLNVEQVGKLASETGLVLLGLSHPKDYIKSLSANITIEIDTARKIAEEVNNGIFSKVKEHLKKLHGIDTGIPQPIAPEKKQEFQKPISPSPISPLPPHSPSPLSSSPPKNPLELFQKHELEKQNSPINPVSEIQPKKEVSFFPKQAEPPALILKQTELPAPKSAEPPATTSAPTPASTPPPLQTPKPIEPPAPIIPTPPNNVVKTLEPNPIKQTENPLIFTEKIREEPHRDQSQTIEIKPDALKIYEKGSDPYREPI